MITKEEMNEIREGLKGMKVVNDLQIAFKK